jgi:hypothetical protein
VAERRSPKASGDGAGPSPQGYAPTDFDRYRPGDRIFIPCAGGPSISRLETYPPPLEMEERYGLYVLEDDGPVEQWRYLFVPHVPHVPHVP